MPIYKGSTNQGLIYYGSPNTNCLTSVPKNVNLTLDPLNVDIVGSPTINDGVVSGFSGSNWLRLPTIFNPSSNAWEMVIKARTPSAFSKRNWLTGGGNAAGKDFDFVTIGLENNGKPMMYITSNGTSWNIANAAISSNTLEVNTDYLFRFQFTGTQYVYSTSVDNGSNWITQVTINSTTSIFVPTTPQAIGNTCYTANAPQFWSGSIDLPNSYIKINGSTWWRGGTGILTLKAGSKVYVPNGFESDGTTPKFDEFITSNDIIDNDFGNASKEVAFLITKSASANNFSVWGGSGVVSGTSTPDFSAYGYWGVWYDTANNIIKIQNGTNEWKTEYGFSLPFCLVSSSDSSVISLDQIFDWCGFIGSTAFVLPGVKGLKSNGIKADCTYNNIEVETKSVLLNNYDYQATGQQFGLSGNGNSIWRTGTYYSQPTAPTPIIYSVWHNTTDNFNYYIGADASTGWVKTTGYDFNVVNSISTDSSFKITSLVPTTVQPLSTGIQISNVYKGSQLVYRFGFDPVTFTANSTWTVPPGIKRIRVDCVAAQGFTYDTATGGYGGRVQCILNVTPGQILYIKVGKQHTAWNDGTYDASDIRTVDADLNSRLVVAGAGGAGTAVRYLRTYTFAGGAGGGTTGAIGGNTAGSANNNATIGIGAGGGTQSAGGAGAYFSMYLKSMRASAGAFGSGGAPASEKPGTYGASGYGGAGWYGGGGGVDGYYWASSSAYGASGAAAGGGSSYTNPTLCSEVVHTQGFRAGSGYITISMV